LLLSLAFQGKDKKRRVKERRSLSYKTNFSSIEEAGVLKKS
jgi:hypothetical protein